MQRFKEWWHSHTRSRSASSSRGDLSSSRENKPNSSSGAKVANKVVNHPFRPGGDIDSVPRNASEKAFEGKGDGKKDGASSAATPDEPADAHATTTEAPTDPGKAGMGTTNDLTADRALIDDGGATTTPNTSIKWEDLWPRAYTALARDEPVLMKNYMDYVAVQCPTAQFRSDMLTDPESVLSIVDQLKRKRDEDQWHRTFSSERFKVDVNLREQSQRLLNFAAMSDRLVKTALTSQPHAGLAWCGVTMILPVSIAPAIQSWDGGSCHDQLTVLR